MAGKAKLTGFIDSLSGSSDKDELAHLRTLEQDIEKAFDQLLNQDKNDLHSSLEKLAFLVDEAGSAVAHEFGEFLDQGSALLWGDDWLAGQVEAA